MQADATTKQTRSAGLGRTLLRLGTAVLPLMLAAPALQAQTWNIQWSDEFNGAANAAPNAANWAYDTGNNNGWGNGEIEFYCAAFSNAAPCSSSRPNTFLDGNGNLVLHAINTNRQWTSGRMNTNGKQSFQYGRVEARMKLQVADGFWPAFWMLGSNLGSVGWPQAGEQDIIEWVQKYGPTTTSSTVHGPGYSGGNGIGKQFTFPNGGRVDDGNFHIYGVVWSPNQMQFYRDNPAQPFFTLTPANIPSGTQWVYNNPFFVLLNFAIGGPSSAFSGPTDASTPNNGTVLVDYVRVYQSSTAINAGSWYSVQNSNSGLCLADPNGGTAQGTPLDQVSCVASTPQQDWQFTPTDSGYYKIVNRNVAYAWDVTGGPTATASRTKVQIYGYGGGTNQQWMPVSLGNGTYKLVARNSGLCLDVPAASTAGTVQLQQYTCNGTAAQAFYLSQQP